MFCLPFIDEFAAVLRAERAPSAFLSTRATLTVMRACLDKGRPVTINDVSGGGCMRFTGWSAQAEADYVLMHTTGGPMTMQQSAAQYGDVVTAEVSGTICANASGLLRRCWGEKRRRSSGIPASASASWRGITCS
jgi:dihydropteroate synthase